MALTVLNKRSNKMKVFQDIKTAIDSWEEDRTLILNIESKLNCKKSEIMGKIGQIQQDRPASDLNAINDKIEELMDSLTDAMSSAEDTESSVSNAQSEMEYVDANDAVNGIQDVQDSFSDFRDKIKEELEGNKE